MSISPQSLATTREKRSSRIPARFDDFSEIPEVRHYKDEVPTTKQMTPVTQSTNTSKTSATSSSRKKSKVFSLMVEPPIETSQNSDSSNLQQPQQISIKSTTSSNISKLEDNVIKKSPFHPSITISNGIRLSGSADKHLIEGLKAENSPVAPVTQSTNTSKTSKTSSTSPTSSSRKRSKGFSLMVKPPNGAFQNNNSSNLQQPQQTKYFNNLTQSMQYGTRLMLNEPIYLPRSIATIAPITTTLQQIANQARKPPFLSKKAEACIAYQEERKFNYLTSNHAALVKITEYLEIEDLCNLRMVNKSWKSIVDCDTVWKCIKIKSTGTIKDWGAFFQDKVCRHRTADLILEKVDLNNDLINSLIDCLRRSSVKRFWLTTEDLDQNTLAYKLIRSLYIDQPSRQVRIIWNVKVMIDDCGLALVPVLPDYICKEVDVYRKRDSSNLLELGDLEHMIKKKPEQFGPEPEQSANVSLDIKPI